jgi:ribosomal protein S8
MYKLTIGSAAMVDLDYQVDADANYVSPEAKTVQKLHDRMKAAGYLSETQDASEAAVWLDLTASVKRKEGSKSTQSVYQLTLKNNLTREFVRIGETIERSKSSKAEKQLNQKIEQTPKLVKEELTSCPTSL